MATLLFSWQLDRLTSCRVPRWRSCNSWLLTLPGPHSQHSRGAAAPALPSPQTSSSAPHKDTTTGLSDGPSRAILTLCRQYARMHSTLLHSMQPVCCHLVLVAHHLPSSPTGNTTLHPQTLGQTAHTRPSQRSHWAAYASEAVKRFSEATQQHVSCCLGAAIRSGLSLAASRLFHLGMLERIS